MCEEDTHSLLSNDNLVVISTSLSALTQIHVCTEVVWKMLLFLPSHLLQNKAICHLSHTALRCSHKWPESGARWSRIITSHSCKEKGLSGKEASPYLGGIRFWG